VSRKPGAIHYGEGDVAMLKENSEELYELNIENFKSVLEGYALSFNVTKEVQVKGPAAAKTECNT
jgi:hypothetical protein